MLSSRDARIIVLWVEKQLSPYTRGCYRHDSERLLITPNLNGHLKTGQMWSLQNRPTERNPNKSSYTLSATRSANGSARKPTGLMLIAPGGRYGNAGMRPAC